MQRLRKEQPLSIQFNLRYAADDLVIFHIKEGIHNRIPRPECRLHLIHSLIDLGQISFKLLCPLSLAHRS